MSSAERETALEACRQLFVSPQVQFDAAVQYEELLRMADKCQRSGLISVGERNELIVEATRHYANAVEAMAMDGESYAGRRATSCRHECLRVGCSAGRVLLPVPEADLTGCHGVA